jgi:alpha-mannosidase
MDWRVFMAEKLYFVDGYHGGIEGHMPVGSWEDILDAMERYPEWKISLEIEPESWDHLRIHDYEVYKRLQTFVSGELTSGRVEFISGSYGQPFCWAINGESNIRQLTRGRELLHKHFEDALVDTYAVQEPCFTSALPQICKKLGYQRISLKNPTAWGGYMDKMKGSMVLLTSADGSGLPAVVRYECEELVSCSATEAAGYDYSIIRDFADKCVENGIKHPVGMCLQDLGWSSHPLISGIPVEYVTWREYFNRFKEDLEGEFKFSQEAVLCTLPWGNITLQQMCRKVRALENRTLQIEKMLGLAEVYGMSTQSTKNKLKSAWDLLLLSQHHDGFICVTTTGSPLKTWAFRADYLTTQGQKLLTEVEHNIFDYLQAKADDEESDKSERYIRVYNTVGSKRTDQAEVIISLPKGYYDLEVYDDKGHKCLSQWSSIRKHQDESVAAANLRFVATVDGIGYNTYCVKLLSTYPKYNIGIARTTIQNTVEVETSQLSVFFDITRGGAIVKLFDKVLQRDFITKKDTIGNLKGFMVDDNAFISNDECVVKHEILINGPIYTKIKFLGEFRGVRFETIAEVREGDTKIDLTSSVDFPEETNIGYPYQPNKGEEFHGRKRSSCREDYKLGISIPLPMEEFVITKNAPFENYKSEVYDTRFNGWDEIKHNIIHQYIDFYSAKEDYGIAILCDHINGYSLVDNQFSLTQAFGYHAGFWWGHQPLKGRTQIAYSVITHKGDYEEGNIPFYNERNNEPFIVQQLIAKPDILSASVISFEDPIFEVVTMFKEEDKVVIRAFNHSKEDKSLSYIHDIPHFEGRKADLNGQLSNEDNTFAKTSEIITLI